jgi:guanylate kinase
MSARGGDDMAEGAAGMMRAAPAEVAEAPPAARRPSRRLRSTPRPGALVVIISGPSGVGKDTIIDAMRDRPTPHERTYVVTCTTRQRRATEVDHRDYHFKTREEFEELRRSGGLLEAAEVHGNWYGTPRDQVVQALAAGRDAVLKIDVQGADAVRREIPASLLVFVVPPSLEELEHRLISRSTENPEDLARRLRNAKAELARKDLYDHVVVNETGEVQATAQAIDDIIEAEHARHPHRRTRLRSPGP